MSKDLQRKLLAGTPLQRELGRVTARLEEVSGEAIEEDGFDDLDRTSLTIEALCTPSG